MCFHVSSDKYTWNKWLYTLNSSHAPKYTHTHTHTHCIYTVCTGSCHQQVLIDSWCSFRSWTSSTRTKLTSCRLCSRAAGWFTEHSTERTTNMESSLVSSSLSYYNSHQPPGQAAGRGNYWLNFFVCSLNVDVEHWCQKVHLTLCFWSFQPLLMAFLSRRRFSCYRELMKVGSHDNR